MVSVAVLLLDGVEQRRRRVGALIEEAGGHAQVLTEIAELRAAAGTMRAGLALVAVKAGLSPDSSNRESARLLKRPGFRVIAYEDGVGQWPMGAKCMPLLAGAAELLDSADLAFAIKLNLRLREELRLLEGRQGEDDEVRTLMQRFGVVGQSGAMMGVFRSVMRFSVLSDLAVLITGETGTGKELLARAIHHLDSQRNAHPFVALNCGAISPALAESELFGHRRGAFSGAERDRRGLVRSAEGGVLFLDEIGELEPGLQGKLLRVLQDSRVLGVGDEKEVPVNVRFVAATHRNLEHMVAEGRFRADLYHRLCVLPIHIPPLRERPADLPPLVQHFVHKYRAVRAVTPPGVSLDFVEALQHLDLNGNARQVENLIRQALAGEQGDGELGLKDLPLEMLHQLARQTGNVGISSSPNPASPSVRSPGPPAALEINELVKRILDGQGWNLSSALRAYERRVIQTALDQTHGNQSQTARLLGITTRSVYNKLRKHRIRSTPSGEPDDIG